MRSGVAPGETGCASESMMWQPDKAQLETIIDMRTAGMGLDAIALALGVSAEDFRAWGNRLRIASYEASVVAPPPPLAAKPSLQDIAERVFEARGGEK
jgi:hypothetical protein